MSQFFVQTSGGGGGSGILVQKVIASSASQATTMEVIPIDNTIPQITEGEEYITAVITPTSSSNILGINFTSQGYTDGTGMTVALFQDAVSDALIAINPDTLSSLSDGSPAIVLNYYMTAGTVSPITFRIRYGGPDPGNTSYMLRAFNLNTFGGIMRSYLTIEEYQV